MSRATMSLAIAAVISLGTLEPVALAGPRFFFEVRGVKTPPGAKADLKVLAGQILSDELKKQPQVVTDLGDPHPQGAALERTLKERRLEGFGLVLRVVRHQHSLQPPAPGKVYRMLMVEVEVAIDAEKIPSGQMALAGDGSAQIGTEVSKVKEKERQQLLREALGEAIQQAVKKSLTKLSTKDAGKGASRRVRKKR